MKKISKLVIALLVLVVAAFAIIACDGGETNVEEIRISKMPSRVTFVQGQDLDLYGGELTVIEDGAEKVIPLDSLDITISGYDKDAVGQQVLTLSYGGKETTLNIRVAKRIAVSVRDLDDLKFFKGMDFVLPQGDIVLTKNDGTSTERVDIGETGVVVTVPNDFSSTTGKKDIQISYQGFTDSFEVEVVDVANIQYVRPNKISYYSHETEMNLEGGMLIYKDSKAHNDLPGGLTRTINLTQDMIVSGTFNPAAANYNDNYVPNGGTELQQAVKLIYGGNEYTHNISIQFSKVSLVQYYADELAAEIDWTDEGFEPSSAQIDKALEAADIYFKLTEAERSYLVAEGLTSVMTLASYHIYNNWFETLTEDYSDVISFAFDPSTESTIINVAAETYQIAKQSMARFNEPAFVELCEMNAILSNIITNEALASLEFGEGVTIADYCVFAVPQSTVEFNLSAYAYAIELHDMLNGITLQSVSGAVSEDNVAKINACFEYIYNSIFFRNRSVYMLVEQWRNGFFDILYQYYYRYAQAIYEQDNSMSDYMTNDGLGRLYVLGAGAYLPGPLEIFYTASQYIYDQFSSDNSYQYVLDGSNFYYYYDILLESLDEIQNSSNTLYKNLFGVMQFAYSYYIVETEPGVYNYDPIYASQVVYDTEYMSMNFYKVTGHGLAHYEDLVDDYMPLIEMYLTGTYMEIEYDSEGNPVQYILSERFYQEVPAFFDKFLTYTASVQTQFLINLSAADGLLDVNAENYYTILSLFLRLYYSEVLDADTYAVFGDLMVSYESFLKRDYETQYGGLAGFTDHFRIAKEAYEDLNAQQKSEISSLYEHVNAIYNLYDNRTMELKNIDLSAYPTWNNRLQKLANFMGDYAFVIYNATSYGAAGPFFAAAAKAEAEYTQILKEISELQDAQLKALLFNAVQFKQYDILSKYFVTTATYSIEEAFLMFRSQYLAMFPDTLVIGQTESISNYWDYDLMERLGTTAEITNIMFMLSIREESNINKLTNNAEFDAAFKSFIANDGEWTLEQKIILGDLHYYSVQSIGDLFLTAFDVYYYYKLGLGEADAQVVDDFMNLIYTHIYAQYYYSIGDTSTASSYRSQHSQMLTAFNQSFNRLSQENKTKFENEFGTALINYYKQTPRA